LGVTEKLYLIDLGDTGYGGVDSVQLPLNTAKGQAFENTAMNIPVPQNQQSHDDPISYETVKIIQHELVGKLFN
jgi:hypothetical protein